MRAALLIEPQTFEKSQRFSAVCPASPFLSLLKWKWGSINNGLEQVCVLAGDYSPTSSLGVGHFQCRSNYHEKWTTLDSKIKAVCYINICVTNVHDFLPKLLFKTIFLLLCWCISATSYPFFYSTKNCTHALHLCTQKVLQECLVKVLVLYRSLVKRFLLMMKML